MREGPGVGSAKPPLLGAANGCRGTRGVPCLPKNRIAPPSVNQNVTSVISLRLRTYYDCSTIFLTISGALALGCLCAYSLAYRS